MKNLKSKSAIALILVLTLTVVAVIAPTANAQVPTRQTRAYLSVNPETIGLNQPLLVNMWVYPSPATLTFNWVAKAFEDMTVTFTKPDGTTHTFMPVDGSGGLEPGESEMIGAIWFHYYPDQVGTWTVQFTMPGQEIGEGIGDEVFYEEATSPPTTFTVVQEPVQIGMPPVDLPTGYWERPINTDNREWGQIAGDWLGGGFGTLGSVYNAYSKAPRSAHIVWKQEAAKGGIIGGDYGGLSYSGGGGGVSVVMMGRGYQSIGGGKFRCFDIRTGETIYEASGSVSYGEIQRATLRQAGTVQTQAATLSAYLWGLGSTSWNRYDAYTGALLQSITSIPRGNPGTTGALGGQSGSLSTTWINRNEVYALLQSGWNTTVPYALAKNEMYKWDYSKVTGNNWTTGIVWNVTLPPGAPGNGGRGSAVWVYEDIGVVNCPGENQFLAYNLTTGDLMYWKTFDFVNMGRIYDEQRGIYFAFDSVEMKYHAFDFKTGNEVLLTDVVGEYPWGVNQYPRAVVYDRLYTGAYDGGLYAIDLATGNIDWSFTTPGTTETPFGAWAMYIGAKIADGVIYMGTSEHTATLPQLRGNRLYAVDAFTGEHIWNISGALGPGPIVDGYLITSGSENSGIQYCFGKGKTETSVTAPKTVAPAGTGIVIEGSVLDMSPAQPGTPAISDEDMSAWMNYIHMQRPEPMTIPTDDNWGTPVDVTGVPVKLIVIHPDGNMEWIYTRTTDMYGHFAHVYEPPTAGLYKIIAAFDGSESYWSSSAETAFGVSPGSSPAQQFGWQELAEAPITTEVAIIAAVAVAAVIGVAAYLTLRKRK